MLSFSLCPIACAKQSQGVQNRSAKVRPVSALSNGDLLFGVVAQVGGAASAWLDVGVTTSTGKPVNARLRLGKREPPEVGSFVPVIVHRLNVPAARVEVRRPPDSNTLPLTKTLHELNTGDSVQARVLAFVSAGAVVDVGAYRRRRSNQCVRCTALLRRKHFAPSWSSPLDKIRVEGSVKVLEVGDQLDLFVREVHPDSSYLFVDAAPVSVDEIEAERIERQNRRRQARMQQRRRPIDALDVGAEINGVVHNVVKFGVFVDVGVNTDGLIHYTDMGRLNWEWKDVVEKGMGVVVRVKTIANGRLNLEFLRFKGEDHDNPVINPALERPEPLQSSNEDIEQSSEEDRSKQYRKEDDEEPEEEGKERDGFEKFTDDYFEEKYLM